MDMRKCLCSPWAIKNCALEFWALRRATVILFLERKVHFRFLGQGFVSVRNTGTKENAVVHIKHENGCNVHIVQGYGMATCGMMVCGEHQALMFNTGDSYYMFKKQLDMFVHWLRTGEEPFPVEETVEMMKLSIGGLRSREEGGREVFLSEIKV